tara:strand:+ start:104 stop:739 length:636 start_codon:yes stop_codon:yes gene_type:complete
MRRYIVLLLITGTVWAQTGLDKLVLKDGTEYLGEYSKIEEKIVLFKPEGAIDFQSIPINKIKKLELKNAQFIILYGKNYVDATIEEKAIYDAKLKGKKYFLYPSLMAVGTPPFFILLEKTTNPKASTVAGQFLITMGYIMASMTISGVITASIFSRMDKIIYPKDLTSEADKRVYKSIHYNKLWMESMKNMTLGTFILVPIFFMFDDFVDL